MGACVAVGDRRAVRTCGGYFRLADGTAERACYFELADGTAERACYFPLADGTAERACYFW